MMAIPDPRVLPNIEFTMDANDKAQSHLSGHPTRPGRTVWTWARHVSDNVSFVMPDFDGWAFPDDTLGGYAPFRDRVAAIDKPFKEKIPKAVWRGTTGVAYKLRDSLVKAGEGKFWSDIKELNEESHVKMHEHCNWQYVVHTEGEFMSACKGPAQRLMLLEAIHGVAGCGICTIAILLLSFITHLNGSRTFTPSWLERGRIRYAKLCGVICLVATNRAPIELYPCPKRLVRP